MKTGGAGVLVALVLACTPPDRAPVQEVPSRTVDVDLRVGGVDGPVTFGLIADMAALDDGGVLVADYMGQQVVHIGPDGAVVRRIGRTGQGPGEFLGPRWIGLLGDTVWVVDVGTYRVSFFDEEGQFLGSVSPTYAEPLTSAYRRREPRGAVSTDRLLVPLAEQNPSRADPRIYRGRFAVLLADPDGHPLDTVALVRKVRPGIVQSPADATRQYLFRQPFDFGTQWVILPHGGGVAVADAEEGGGTWHLVVLAVGPDGDTLWALREAYVPQRLEAARVDSIESSKVETALSLPGFGYSNPVAARAAVDAAMDVPEFEPTVTGLAAVGTDGVLVRREEASAGERQRWTWVRRGEVVMDLLLPPGVHVMSGTRNYLWGVWKDEYDVEYAVRLPVPDASEVPGGG